MLATRAPTKRYCFSKMFWTTPNGYLRNRNLRCRFSLKMKGLPNPCWGIGFSCVLHPPGTMVIIESLPPNCVDTFFTFYPNGMVKYSALVFNFLWEHPLFEVVTVFAKVLVNWNTQIPRPWQHPQHVQRQTSNTQNATQKTNNKKLQGICAIVRCV